MVGHLFLSGTTNVKDILREINRTSMHSFGIKNLSQLFKFSFWALLFCLSASNNAKCNQTGEFWVEIKPPGFFSASGPRCYTSFLSPLLLTWAPNLVWVQGKQILNMYFSKYFYQAGKRKNCWLFETRSFTIFPQKQIRLATLAIRRDLVHRVVDPKMVQIVLSPPPHTARKAQRYVCVMQHKKWKQLLPRRVFTQKAEAVARANNGGDVYFSRCDASRILCGWGYITCWWLFWNQFGHQVWQLFGFKGSTLTCPPFWWTLESVPPWVKGHPVTLPWNAFEIGAFWGWGTCSPSNREEETVWPSDHRNRETEVHWGALVSCHLKSQTRWGNCA